MSRVTLTDEELGDPRWYFTPPPRHEVEEMAEAGEVDNPEALIELFTKLGLEGYKRKVDSTMIETPARPTPENTHTSLRQVYRIEEDWGRGFGVSALFTAHPEDVDAIQGMEIHFGEICGKHSDISLRIEADTIRKVEAPPVVVGWLEEHLGRNVRYDPYHPWDSFSITGHNPFEDLEAADVFENDDD